MVATPVPLNSSPRLNHQTSHGLNPLSHASHPVSTSTTADNRSSVPFHPLPPRPPPRHIALMQAAHSPNCSCGKHHNQVAPQPPTSTPTLQQSQLPSSSGKIKLTDKDYEALARILPRRDRQQIQYCLSHANNIHRLNKNEVLAILNYLNQFSTSPSRYGKSTLKNYIVQLLICRLEFPASTTQNSYVPPPPVVSVEQPPSNPQCTVNMITNILHQNQAARQLFNLVDKCHFSRNSLVTPIALARFYSPRSQTILADFKMEIDARTRRLVMGQECNVSSLADRWWVASPQLDENRKKRRKVLMYVVADQNNGAPAYLYSQHLLQADHVCTVNGVQAWAPYNGRPLMDSWADITHGFRGAFALIEKGSDLPVSVTVKMQRLRQSYYHGGNSTISGTVCILCVDEVDVDETLLILYEGKLKQRGITLGIFEGLESGTPQWSREFWRPSPCAYTMENERFPVEPCILSSDGKDLLPRFVDRYLNALKLEAEIKTVVAGVSVSDDLELGDEIVQFKDPVSLGRMECAVKGKGCSHKACFDARTFITLNETTPRWRCPVCRGNVKLDELQLDDRVTLLLDKYRDHDHCIVHPDGSDSPPKSKEGPFQSQGGNGDVGGIVVGYTTFDDEETEAEEEEDQQVRKRRRKVLAVIELDDDDGDMYVSPPTKKVAAEASGTMIGSAGNIIPVYEID